MVECDLTKKLIETIPKLYSSKVTILATIKGQELSNLKYYNPFTFEDASLISSEHVTSKQGTGLVHIAPAFGHDDFKLAIKNNLKTVCSIDENGNYDLNDESFKKLSISGKNAFDDNTIKIIERILDDKLLHKHSYVHSYPYDWRTKKPVIIRSSQQWFINTELLKDRALELLKSVKIRPQNMSNSMISTLSNRSYWCISRQRVWGLPIPCLFDPKNESAEIIDDALIQNVKRLIKTDGNANFWWSNKYDKELNAIDFLKSKDIFDIWFDSGSSFNSVLNSEKADLYCEGVDQFSGWFQASLLLSAALNNQSPYKAILVHGFVVDEQNRKMSKSVGNIIEPLHAIKGNTKKKIPECGNDVLRFWLLSEYHKNQIPIGAEILEKMKQRVFGIRSILRFLIGNTNDFNKEELIEYDLLLEPDKYLLHQLSVLVKQTCENYEDMNLNKILIPIENFLLGDVSGFYIKSSKDRLYCEKKNSNLRKCAQTVLLHTLEKCLIMLGPVMPHLMEEAYTNSILFNNKAELPSLFQSKLSFKSIYNPQWQNENVNNLFTALAVIKNTVNSIIKSKNLALYEVIITLDKNFNELFGFDFNKQNWLPDYFGCSNVKLEFTDLIPSKCVIINSKEYKYDVNLVELADKYSCLRCRRFINDTKDCLCDRCSIVIES